MDKKFIASYSGGKDSILAIYRAIKAGYEPIGLINTFNTDKERSWFHGLSESLLKRVEASLGIPIQLVRTSGEAYSQNFEKALLEARNQGAEYCVFGDIDIEGHRVWCRERCEAVGLTAYFPLWGESREVLVLENIDLGFKAYISVLKHTLVDEKLLGKPLSRSLVESIAQGGADICGENGEYHTFVADGPLFKQPVDFSFDSKITWGEYSALPIL